jgi:hypothetical protein
MKNYFNLRLGRRGMRREPTRGTAMRDWSSLTEDEQTELRIAFGHYLDGLPPTCSLDTKVERFRAWLAERGVLYRDVVAPPGDDVTYP